MKLMLKLFLLQLQNEAYVCHIFLITKFKGKRHPETLNIFVEIFVMFSDSDADLLVGIVFSLFL